MLTSQSPENKCSCLRRVVRQSARCVRARKKKCTQEGVQSSLSCSRPRNACVHHCACSRPTFRVRSGSLRAIRPFHTARKQCFRMKDVLCCTEGFDGITTIRFCFTKSVLTHRWMIFGGLGLTTLLVLLPRCPHFLIMFSSAFFCLLQGVFYWASTEYLARMVA